MADEFKIGIEAGGTAGMALLSALTEPVPTPQAKLDLFVEYDALGDGAYRGQGGPIAVWTFPILTLDQRNQLRAYCMGASETVYIRTIDDVGDYADYLAEMVWPVESPRIVAGTVRDLAIRFEMLVEQAVVS